MDVTKMPRLLANSVAWGNFHSASLVIFNIRTDIFLFAWLNYSISLSFLFTGTSQHMYVEFVSSPAGPLLNTGFHFNVGNWPGHVEPAGVKTGLCDWLLSSNALKQTSASEGIFLSVAHWYPPNTTCNYHIQGVENEIVRLYFPRWVSHIIGFEVISNFRLKYTCWG